MNLIYGVNDRPKFGQVLVFAFQQLLAILAATIAVPAIIGNGMTQSAALFGAGAGTLIYLLLTKFRSPVFLGSSFAFIGSMFAAFAGGVSASLGFAGLILGAIFAGLVYVVIAIIVKIAGVNWINKLMPPVVIGPTVAIIGLSLSGNAVADSLKFAAFDAANGVYNMTTAGWVCLVCALITVFTVIGCSVYGKKGVRLIPFIIGILAGYVAAAIFTVIGNYTGNDALKVLNIEPFLALFANGVTLTTFINVPDFTFMTALKGINEITPAYISTIAVAYIPVAFVVFAEHIADHKNLSTIIDQELLEEPGLHRTLLGDGIGSMVGALFGGCPNTTYGESVGCVAITRNASIITIFTTAILAIASSFVAPFVTFLATIPACVMGGVCITLYGFIAVSGLKMLSDVNLSENRNLFVVSVILITGIGGMALQIGAIKITSIACALILGIIVNLVVSRAKEQ